MCSGSNSAGALSDIDGGGYYFRTAPPDRLQAIALARLVARGRNRPVVIAPTDSYGTTFGRGVVAALRRRRIRPRLVPGREPAPTRPPSWPRARRPARTRVVLVGFPDGVAPLLKALVAAGKAPRSSRSTRATGCRPPTSVRSSTRPTLRSWRRSRGTTPAGAPAGIDHPFNARMLAAGVEPFFSASAYDCTILVGLAAMAAKSDDADEIRDALRRRCSTAGSTADRSSSAPQLLRAGRTIHYRGAFSAYDAWRGTEPGTGVYDVWTMGLDAHPAAAAADRSARGALTRSAGGRSRRPRAPSRTTPASMATAASRQSDTSADARKRVLA